MLKIGLTGGIGSGKSTISSILRDCGFSVIDADIAAREVLNIYPQILKEINDQFGKGFFDKDGNLKRKEFGNYIFAAKERREIYESIIIPYIKEYIFTKLKEFEVEGKNVCFVDAATLIENNIHEQMDVNILVYVDLKTQIERVRNRDKLTDREVVNRINSQMSLEEKRKFVDFIIDNSKTVEYTKKELFRVLEEIVQKYGGWSVLK